MTAGPVDGRDDDEIGTRPAKAIATPFHCCAPGGECANDHRCSRVGSCTWAAIDNDVE